MDDPRLEDFAYPGDDAPDGVIERRLSKHAVKVIREVAASIRDGLDATPGQRRDCRRASSAWERVLAAHGIDVQVVGGEGVDGEVFTSKYRLVPLDRRSGYREEDDLIHRHYWLVIGPERRIFDPTAHQFDARGGASLDRYTVGGRPVTATRTP